MTEIFKTNRLRVQKLSIHELLPFYRLYSDPAMMRYVGPTLSFKEASEKFYSILHQYRTKQKFETWGVWLDKENEFIGLLMLKKFDKVTNALEIGYRVDKSYWGNGFTKEVVAAAIQYAFDELNTSKMVALIHPQNTASRKVLICNGFFREKITYYKQMQLECFATYAPKQSNR